MASRFSLDGGMIPRAVKRIFDQRDEERVEPESLTASMVLRGRNQLVRVVNLSRSGAMVIFSGMPHIGEQVSLQLLDRPPIRGQVRWVRDGRIGIHFATPLE